MASQWTSLPRDCQHAGKANAAITSQAEKKARADIMQLLRQLEVRLKDSPYLAGEECSVADIAVASCLRPLFVSVFGEMERKNSPSMSAWVQKLYASVGLSVSCHIAHVRGCGGRNRSPREQQEG